MGIHCALCVSLKQSCDWSAVKTQMAQFNLDYSINVLQWDNLKATLYSVNATYCK